MSQRLAGKVAAITGAAQGIGRATAELFAREGATVVALDLNEAKLAEIEGAGIQRKVLNVLDDAAVRSVFGAIGQVDILFNCAGVVHGGTILDMPDADLDFALDLNVKALVRTCRVVLPGMLERGDGCIINMSSVASSVKGVPNRFAYQTSKAAVVGLTKSIATDYVSKGIRCNAICPGTVESPSLQERLSVGGDYAAARAAFVARQPIGRIGQPDEIADLALYLAIATYTTGQVHVIDGGWSM